MRTFPKSIATGALAAALLVGAAVPSMAAPSNTADVDITINDDGTVYPSISASAFDELTYSETNVKRSHGTLTFTVNDPRYAKGDWQLTATIDDFGPSFMANVELDSTSSSAGITADATSLTATSPAVVMTAGVGAGAPPTSSNAVYDAWVVVPIGTAPGDYTATVTVAVTNLAD